MDERTPSLPDDFGRRIRAAAGYLGVGLERFARMVDRDGAGYSTMKGWVRGEGGPNELARRALIERLAEVSELPEDFFWDRRNGAEGVVQEQLSQLDDQIRQLRVETAARDAEVLKRLDEGFGTNHESRPGQQ